MSDALPITQVLPLLKTALAQHHEVVLQAPPGAGKTTSVPLALLDQDWLQNKKILMLEPRRLAARGAAERMSAVLGEALGQTVGYRVRLESKMSAQTRIEIVTEGILTRYLQDDPSLEDYGLIIFDEFHERSLDADLGLALTLQGRSLLREEDPLKLLLMSATLDGAPVAALLGEHGKSAPVIVSEGRQYPVSVEYGPSLSLNETLGQIVAQKTLEVLQEQEGSVLVFLPGQGEIRQVETALAQKLETLPEMQERCLLAPLYGDLTIAQQRQAIAPAPAGKRKVVLATSIAESSLTIEGVCIVIDAGLSRVPVFDPNTGMTRLHTRRLSRASSVQRMGRAGRMEPGRCYRLWTESQQQQLQAFSAPEIAQADLAPLALALHQWGVSEPGELRWLDCPATAPYDQARDLLVSLGALTPDYQMTPHGQSMGALPVHPRLAHMLLKGASMGQAKLAADLASLLGERDILGGSAGTGPGADMALRLAALEGPGHNSAKRKRLQQQSRQYLSLIRREKGQATSSERGGNVGHLLALAYPDRIARRRGEVSLDYKLSNGRNARLSATDPLRKSEWLVAAHLGGRSGDSSDRVFLASDFDSQLLAGPLESLCREVAEVEWDKKQERFVAEKQRRLGAIVVSRERMSKIPLEEKRSVLLTMIRQRGLSLLPWSEALRNWQARVLLLRELAGDNGDWPDLRDETLLATLPEWLGPYLDEVNLLSHFSKLDLSGILKACLSWEQRQALDSLAPERFLVPSGSHIAIDYCQSPPVLAVKLQEMFGSVDTPAIAGQQLSLQVHLLTPARRPLAVTQDLKSFWQNAYPDVKKEYRGRYPKHHWPDDPLAAVATARVKPRPKK